MPSTAATTRSCKWARICANSCPGGASPQQLEGLALQRSDADQGTGGINGRQAADVVIFALRDLCPNA